MEQSLYFSLLPSETCRLVLGFLMDSGCLQTANVFLQECRYLSELREVLHRTPNTSFRLPGFTFNDVLKDYIAVINTLNEKRDRATIGFGPSDIPICRPGSAIASLRHFLFEFKKSRKEVSTQCDNLPKSFSANFPKILSSSNQQCRHFFIRHSTPCPVNSAKNVESQSKNANNLSVGVTQTVPSVPQIPTIISKSSGTGLPETNQVLGTSESQMTVAVMGTTQFDNSISGTSGPSTSFAISMSTNDTNRKSVSEYKSPKLRAHNGDLSVTDREAATMADLQTIPFVTSPAGLDDTLDLESAKIPEHQIQFSEGQNASNVSSTGSSRRKPVHVQRTSSTASDTSQFKYVFDSDRIISSVAAHAETFASKINSCLSPREEALVFNGLNDKDFEEFLNIMEVDFNVGTDADFTDLQDILDPFSIEDPNLSLPALPPPKTSNDAATVENPKNAPKEVSSQPQTSVERPKCARKKSIPRKRISAVFEDFFDFHNNSSSELDYPLEVSGGSVPVPSTPHADPNGIAQVNPTEPATNIEPGSSNSGVLTKANKSPSEGCTVNPPILTEFIDLDKTPMKNLPKKCHTTPEPGSSVQASPSLRQTPRSTEMELKPASVSQNVSPQVKPSETQTPRTMEIASALVSLSLVEPSRTQSGSSKIQTRKHREVASKPISMLRNPLEQGRPSPSKSRKSQRRRVTSNSASEHIDEPPQEKAGLSTSRAPRRKARPSTSRRKPTTPKRNTSTSVKSKPVDRSPPPPTITQSFSGNEIPTKPIKRKSESVYIPSSKRQKCADGEPFVVDSVNEFARGSETVKETCGTADTLTLSRLPENAISLPEVAKNSNNACATEVDAADNLPSHQNSATTSANVPESLKYSGSAIESQHSHMETSTTGNTDSSQRPNAAPESRENHSSFGSLTATSSEAVTSGPTPTEMIEYSIPIQVICPVSDATGETYQSDQSAYICSADTASQVIESDVLFQIIDLNDPKAGHLPTKSSPDCPNLPKSRLLQHIKTMRQNVGDSFSLSLRSQMPCESSVRDSIPMTSIQQSSGTLLQSSRLIVRIPKDVVMGCGEMTSQELLMRALQQQLAVSASVQMQQGPTISSESTQVLQDQHDSSVTTLIRQKSVTSTQHNSMSSPNAVSVKENVSPSPNSTNERVGTANIDRDPVQRNVLIRPKRRRNDHI